jgi:hypothetical protein
LLVMHWIVAFITEWQHRTSLGTERSSLGFFQKFLIFLPPFFFFFSNFSSICFLWQFSTLPTQMENNHLSFDRTI